MATKNRSFKPEEVTQPHPQTLAGLQGAVCCLWAVLPPGAAAAGGCCGGGTSCQRAGGTGGTTGPPTAGGWQNTVMRVCTAVSGFPPRGGEQHGMRESWEHHRSACAQHSRNTIASSRECQDHCPELLTLDSLHREGRVRRRDMHRALVNPGYAASLHPEGFLRCLHFPSVCNEERNLLPCCRPARWLQWVPGHRSRSLAIAASPWPSQPVPWPSQPALGHGSQPLAITASPWPSQPALGHAALV